MNKSKSSLFLMELIMAILIFAIASAVCIQIFVKAHIVGNATQELNHAVTICTSAAELYYGLDGDMMTLRQNLDKTGTSTESSGDLFFYYDSNFTNSTSEQSSYTMKISRQLKGSVTKATITFSNTETGKELYSLDCSLFNKNI